MSEREELIECPDCGGQGGGNERIVMQVTRDMALDAGDASLEGEPVDYGDVWHECGRCDGMGRVPAEERGP